MHARPHVPAEPYRVAARQWLEDPPPLQDARNIRESAASLTRLRRRRQPCHLQESRIYTCRRYFSGLPIRSIRIRERSHAERRAIPAEPELSHLPSPNELLLWNRALAGLS